MQIYLLFPEKTNFINVKELRYNVHFLTLQDYKLIILSQTLVITL